MEADASRPAEDARQFFMHRRSNHAAVAGVFLFILLLESFVVHLVVARHARVLAWVITASSLWLAYYLVADVRAVRRQPLRLEEHGLRFAVGLRWRGFVPYAAIVAVEPGGGDRADPATLRATVFGAGDLVLAVKEPLEAAGPFGLRRRFRRLALSVDRPDDLRRALNAERDRA